MHSFHTRLKRLERGVRWQRPCTVCGAGELIPRRVIRASAPGAPMATCQACGRFIDDFGWPVAASCVRVSRGIRGFTR